MEINNNDILPSRRYDGTLFTYASSAKRLLEAIGMYKYLKFCGKIYSIGPKTTECLKRHGIADIIQV